MAISMLSCQNDIVVWRQNVTFETIRRLKGYDAFGYHWAGIRKVYSIE